MTRPPGAPPPAPHLTPTRPSTLILSALLAGVVGWSLLHHFHGDVQQLPWLSAVTLVLLAITEAITAWTIKARIERRPGTEPVEPLFVARLAALAKASSLAGALFTGLYGGIAVWAILNRDSLRDANADFPVAGGGVLASALLVAAALWLEYACRVPKGPDDTYADPDNGRDDESVTGL